MGKEITIKMIEAVYRYSKEVYHERLSKKDALDCLVNDFDMDRGSASGYIVNFQKMIEGDLYKRTNNPEATNYYLTNILKDYGFGKLFNATKSANNHLAYYENLERGSPQYKVRAIVKHHERIINEISDSIYPDEIINPEAVFEGLKRSVTINSYERNPLARKKCIEHYGVRCFVCKFDFEEVYGLIGNGFIHVHHLKPLSEIGKEYEINPVEDLRPVCPNCHAMLHKKNPPFMIEELKDKLELS